MCNRTPRWGVHPPVQALAASFILFSRLPQEKTKCRQVSSLRQKNSASFRFFVEQQVCYNRLKKQSILSDGLLLSL